jgi:hypothetical protein
MKSKGDEYDACYFFFEDEEVCGDAKETNKGLLWAGIGAMAGWCDPARRRTVPANGRQRVEGRRRPEASREVLSEPAGSGSPLPSFGDPGLLP